MLTVCIFAGVTMYVVETLTTDFCVWLTKRSIANPRILLWLVASEASGLK